MRKILKFVFPLLLFVSCSEKRNDLKENNLNGKVWKIQETAFNATDKFGSYQTDDKKYSGHSFLIFNQEGNIVEYRSLDKNGKTNWTNKHSYNKDNVRTEVTTIEDGKVDRKQISIFENDKIKGIEFYDKDGIKTEIYEYELSGNTIIGGKIKNKNNKLTASFKNELSNGFLDKQTVRDSIGNLDYQVSYKRNKQNDVIEYNYVNKKDSINHKYKFQYEYDEQNNWIKRIDFDKENKLDQIVIRNIIYFSDKEKKRTENDFIGMWFVLDDNDWIEMRSDKKYDSGYSSRIKSSGTWEVNASENLLTFRAIDPSDSKKYRFEFEGYQLVLYTIEGKEDLRLEKR